MAACARALQLLHSQQAEQFVQREGFGKGRMPRPSTRNLTLPSAPTINPDNVSYPVAMLEGDPKATLPKTGLGEIRSGQLPSVERLLSLHTLGQFGFVSPDSVGLVKSRNEVGGLRAAPVPVQSRRAAPGPEAGEGQEGKRALGDGRLELVSLLKSEKPAVYVSVQLPRMEDLKKKPRRELTAFEDKGLKPLKGGEDLVTEATTNRILMLAALRASKQCLECHHGQRGELLGSFSYELLRDPPILAR